MMVAETGLKWHDDGKLALPQDGIMNKVPALLLVLLFCILERCGCSNGQKTLWYLFPRLRRTFLGN
jgi:hypothetical protein